MNQNLVIGIIIVVILIGVAWYFFSSDNGDLYPAQNGNATSTVGGATTTPGQAATTSTSTTGGTGGGSATGTGSARALLSRGGNYTCSFETIDPNKRATGTVFVEGAKMRATLRTQQSGSDRVLESNVIRSGTQTYIWTTGSTQGVRTTVSATAPLTLPTSGGVSLDLNNITLDWNCRPWIPKQEEFVIPTSVNFVAQ